MSGGFYIGGTLGGFNTDGAAQHKAIAFLRMMPLSTDPQGLLTKEKPQRFPPANACLWIVSCAYCVNV